MDRDLLGATASAQQDSGVGGNATDPTTAQATRGPEVGGTEHVGTAEPGTAIGQTSTYSTRHLAKGDPTPSVIDPESSDPTTFKKPESSLAGATSSTETGLASNAAQLAASRAFTGSSQGGKQCVMSSKT